MTHIIKLTDAEIKMVLQADDYLGAYAYNSSATRYYTIARDRGEMKNHDIAVILCGVMNINKRVVCHPIGIASVDSKIEYYDSECDILQYFMGVRLKLYFNDDNGMVKDEFKGKTLWWSEGKRKNVRHNIWTRPLNINQVIAANPRFRYCALPKWGTPTLWWLRKYAECPDIENFAKMNVPYLANKKFVDALKKDREYFRFFRDHLDTIRDLGLPPRNIRYAYVHKVSPMDSIKHYQFLRKVKSVKMELTNRYYGEQVDFPKGFDWTRLSVYLAKNRISNYEYRRYANYCVGGGANLLDPNTAFPPNLEIRLKAFDDEKHRMECKECNEQLVKRAKQYLKTLKGMKMDEFSVVVPSDTEHFVAEGNTMENCIGGGGYARRMAAGSCVCVFIRKASEPDKPFVDCEIVDGKVKQCYAFHNSAASDKVRRFARRIAKRLYARKAA